MNTNDMKELTDKQILAGVAALREIERKFRGQPTDQAVVNAVYFAILEAADQPPTPSYYG
jgi:hypothetical protein